MSDLQEINIICKRIDSAYQNRRDLLKYSSAMNSPTSYRAIDTLVMSSGYARVSESMPEGSAFNIEQRLREEVLKEVDKFIKESIDTLKKKYNVLYEQKDRFNDPQNFTS